MRFNCAFSGRRRTQPQPGPPTPTGRRIWLTEFALRPFPDGWIRRSHTIAQQATARLGILTLDLIHVAAAVELEADALFSFDERQRRLARELKLKLN